MSTLIFYVMLCVSPNECTAFEPYSWSYSNEQERELAYKECSTLVNAYDTLQATKETDCYVQE